MSWRNDHVVICEDCGTNHAYSAKFYRGAPRPQLHDDTISGQVERGLRWPNGPTRKCWHTIADHENGICDDPVRCYSVEVETF